jgi:hypothetical protein
MKLIKQDLCRQRKVCSNVCVSAGPSKSNSVNWSMDSLSRILLLQEYNT